MSTGIPVLSNPLGYTQNHNKLGGPRGPACGYWACPSDKGTVHYQYITNTLLHPCTEMSVKGKSKPGTLPVHYQVRYLGLRPLTGTT